MGAAHSTAFFTTDTINVLRVVLNAMMLQFFAVELAFYGDFDVRMLGRAESPRGICFEQNVSGRFALFVPNQGILRDWFSLDFIPSAIQFVNLVIAPKMRTLASRSAW